MESRKRRQSRWKPGMVYAVPLSDGSYGIAQAGDTQGEFVNVIYVAMYCHRFLDLPTSIPDLTRDYAVSLSSTWRQALNRGEWLSIGVAPETFNTSEFPNEQFAKKGYVGARTCDAGILSDFLSAYHGLIPWNIMHDPKFFDAFLRPESPKPPLANVLSEQDREKYRREVYNIVT
jgi:hypothetical protein